MKRTQKAQKALDKQIEALYAQHAQGLRINVMDIGKVFQAGRLAADMGASIEDAVKDAIRRHCVPA